MIIRLNDRLQVTEEQKTEITSMLFTFIKKIYDEKKAKPKELSTVEIMNMWLKYTEKPQWIQDKIDEDIEFLAGVCEFIDMYKKDIVSQDIDEYNIKYKM